MFYQKYTESSLNFPKTSQEIFTFLSTKVSIVNQIGKNGEKIGKTTFFRPVGTKKEKRLIAISDNKQTT